MNWRRTASTTVVTTLALGTIPVFATAHVDYVTDPVRETRDALAFARQVLSDPLNASLLAGAFLVALVVVVAYLRYRPTIFDVLVLRQTLETYGDLVPWMLRLSLGLPLVGAGFQGYLFVPTLPFDPAANPSVRLSLIGVGFLLLFGLATRVVSTAGLALYLWALASSAEVLLAFEYVPGFFALFILGGGRPSADDILQNVAATDGTFYGRIDPVHHVKAWLDERTAPYRPFVPTILRIGMGSTFVYLGLTQKLGDPARSLQVVSKYGLTGMVPVDAGMWVLGAGLLEIAVGVALVVGFLTRASAATAFVLFTLTLFGLPDDPVLAHVTLFGMASAAFTLGAGPFSLDARLSRDRSTSRAASAADA